MKFLSTACLIENFFLASYLLSPWGDKITAAEGLVLGGFQDGGSNPHHPEWGWFFSIFSFFVGDMCEWGWGRDNNKWPPRLRIGIGDERRRVGEDGGGRI